MLLGDNRIRALHELLQDQIVHLYTAYRSPKFDELAATYSYQGGRLWDYYEEFNLCNIQSDNAKGIVSFGGGMLAGIRLEPNDIVNNPKNFSLEHPKLTDINVPSIESPPEPEGWVKELESCGLLRRYSVPKDQDSVVDITLLHSQYNELFTMCDTASIVLDNEEFSFISPKGLGLVKDRIGTWVPILDMRELGGLGIIQGDEGCTISYIVNGDVCWSMPDLHRALIRLDEEYRT